MLTVEEATERGEYDRRLLVVLRDVSHPYTAQLSVQEIQYQARMARERLLLHNEEVEPFKLVITID